MRFSFVSRGGQPAPARGRRRGFGGGWGAVFDVHRAIQRDLVVQPRDGLGEGDQFVAEVGGVAGQEIAAQANALGRLALAAQLGIFLDHPHRHAGGAQLEHEVDEAHLGLTVDALTAPAWHRIDQADLLVIAQRVRGEAGGESGLGDRHRIGHPTSVRLRVRSKSTGSGRSHPAASCGSRFSGDGCLRHPGPLSRDRRQ
jgi:hypothetical protein